MVSIPNEQTSVFRSHYNSLDYTSDGCALETHNFFDSNDFPMISTNNKIGRPQFLVFKCVLFEFVNSYYGLIKFCG